MIEARGLEIFRRIEGRKPNVFSHRNLTGKLMEWSMRNEDLKTRLFRLVDVLPTLKRSKDVVQHTQEYLGDRNSNLPGIARAAVRVAQLWPGLAALGARIGVRRMAGSFIVAEHPHEALKILRRLRGVPLAFTVDLLGETAVSEVEASEYQRRYLELIDLLSDAAASWSRIEQIDADESGFIPVVNVSVKISALYSQIRAMDPETAIREISHRLLPIMLQAKKRGAFVNFDMESTALKDLTLRLFRTLLELPELTDFHDAGLAIQAYLKESARDLDELIGWAQSQKRRITIRLIKGAYWDYETIMAAQRGWPVPLFQTKAETDASYERLAAIMLANPDAVKCAFGTHNVRSIAACMIHAERLGRPANAMEFQMLYGMAEPIKGALAGMGYRVRDYCPIGEVLPGMSYLVRRLLENTSNESFLRSTFTTGRPAKELLCDPVEVASDHSSPSVVKLPFANCPLTDFTIDENRTRMIHALEAVRQEFGRDYPLMIGRKSILTGKWIISRNPANLHQVLGRVAKAGAQHAEDAIAIAEHASMSWRETLVSDRAKLLETLADKLAEERFNLAAWEIFETGKNWVESDADAAEAIDFCRYYAREMRRIATTNFDVPGESNLQHYLPRGIAAVIAPWNFPLAILCGMATAALVTGNCVIIKPSEQSSIIAAHFVRLLLECGFPSGVANYLPGSGEETGAFLAAHPKIALVGFTGSREVGLKIWQTAGVTLPGQRELKKVICEMGGKNALIIDSDADLDEAIPAIIQSAFGYSGQKCSALSRLIVLESIHDRVVERLIEACRGLSIGAPELPGTVVGPLIDEAAVQKVRNYIELGRSEAKLSFQSGTPSGNGCFVPLTIFTEASPDSRIAREEIFGPVLSVLKARDLQQAIAWANSSPYALTAGIFSRSPRNIDLARSKLEAGNIYINRGITGALVGRQPFGGYRMSGGGTKAGGPDYLLQFMFPRVITENTLRRGFAPEGGATGEAGE
jgi:RHH-type proline utilization regulon transcriptional repressor/proline dehydrogenase/delta 1-pyrroline-5-carboxylate dehydrogenase